MIKYLIPFLAALLFTSVFIFLLKFFLGNGKWEGRISDRHIHHKKTFRLGGAAMILAFNLAIFSNPDLVISPELFGTMLASCLILVMGVWDDVREISWKSQLFYQIAVAIIIFIFGIRIYGIRNPLAGGIINLETGMGVLIAFLISILWIVIIINSMNWLDGIDGLSGGIFFICSMAMFVLSLRPEVNQPPVAILAMILAGSALGFLFFNFYPSVIMAGTSGSMFMGFILATLAIFAGTKVATAILVLSLPIIDFIWVIGERLRQKKSIFTADKNHLHHKLLELGWSQKKITLYYYAITAIITIIALNTRAVGKSLAFAGIFIIAVSVLLFINKKLAKA